MPYYYYNFQYLIYILPGLLLAMWAQAKIQKAFGQYSKVRGSSGFTGREVARQILDRNGLNDVSIEPIRGQLTDHYDPRDKTLRLSEGVYNSPSVAAVSIAAHECGHAIQDATDYRALRIRTSLVPIANFGSRFSFWIIILGYLFSSGTLLVKVGIWLFAATVLFQIVTLPVEFNASSRAMEQLESGFLTSSEMEGTKSVLSAAAMTYVASTLMAIGSFLRILSMFSRDRR